MKDSVAGAVSGAFSRALYGGAEERLSSLEASRLEGAAETQTLEGAGEVHEMRGDAIASVAVACGLAPPAAQALLEDARWDVGEAVRRHSAAIAGVSPHTGEGGLREDEGDGRGGAPQEGRKISIGDGGGVEGGGDGEGGDTGEEGGGEAGEVGGDVRGGCDQVGAHEGNGEEAQEKDEGARPGAPIESKPLVCVVCWEELGEDRPFLSPGCEHVACKDCWVSYVEARLSEGNTTLLRCPVPDCAAVVPEAALLALLPPDLEQRFRKLAASRFVDVNDSVKWCPAPGCGRPVTVRAPLRGRDCAADALRHGRALDVACECGAEFCFSCGQPPHEPASCSAAAEWARLEAAARQKGEAGAELWVLENTQKCPGCGAAIQRSTGCNHMTCAVCRHQFCWVCRRPWKEHSQRTGGYYQCNMSAFEDAGRAGGGGSGDASSSGPGGPDPWAWVQERRFMFYYRKAGSHDVPRGTLEPHLRRLEATAGCYLADDPDACLFLRELLGRVVEAHRVLRNSYIMCFQLEWTPARRYLESLQGQMEALLEGLGGAFALPPARPLRRDGGAAAEPPALGPSQLDPRLLQGATHLFHALGLVERRAALQQAGAKLEALADRMVRGVRSGVLEVESNGAAPAGGAGAVAASVLDLFMIGARQALAPPKRTRV